MKAFQTFFEACEDGDDHDTQLLALDKIPHELRW